jgi:hypothetical protein
MRPLGDEHDRVDHSADAMDDRDDVVGDMVVGILCSPGAGQSDLVWGASAVGDPAGRGVWTASG